MSLSPSPPRLSVALLESDHVDANLRDIDGDYGEMFARLFTAHAPEVVLDRIDVVGGEALPPLGAHDGIVITGSRRSATDDLPWITGLVDLIRAAHAAEAPLVGICFGHQLIAHALGGRVERAPAGWGIGVHAATVTTPRPWMEPAADGFRMLVSHQDQVAALPPDGRVIASSPHAPISAFEVGSLLGFQGHPEFRAPYADALMRRRVERIGPPTVDAARTTLAEPTDHATVARWIARFIAAG